jgi:epoxyqueuosine reductase
MAVIILWQTQELALPNSPTRTDLDYTRLKADIVRWAMELGFQQLGVTDTDLSDAELRLNQWLERKFHGSMSYMQKHGAKRTRPDLLVPGTLRVISARMDYLPGADLPPADLLDHPSKAYISRYALGRDYHKVLRKRLQSLASRIEGAIGTFGYRVFVDSAPVLEKPIAEKAGLGWIGLPLDERGGNHCGTCRACMDVCPTGAIVAPYLLDATRCISYLTIELDGPIPDEFRSAIGNRIYGCDDCQLFCPWNKFAAPTQEDDFGPRQGLESAELVELFCWTEQEWREKTAGSPIRRIGFERWLRNLAVALGNAETSDSVLQALRSRQHSDSALVREHVGWALSQHRH